jgi:cytochrome c oxidase cbb3-type subunit I
MPLPPARYPTIRESIDKQRAEMKARMHEMKERYLEPILSRFPTMLPTKPDSAARWGLYSSLFWFLIWLLMALTRVIKVVFPGFLDNWGWFSYGRLRQAEPNVLLWGVLFTGLVGAAFAILPRLCRTTLWSERIGTQSMILHNQVVLAGTVLIMLGRTQGITGGEWIVPIDIALVNVFFMVAQNLFATMAKRTQVKLYISAWYFLAAFVLLPVSVAIANFASPYFSGVKQAILVSFGQAGVLTGLTLLGLGVAHFVLPRATGNPLASGRTAMVAFWALLLTGPFIGPAFTVLGPMQDWVETLGIVMATAMVIPAVFVLWTLLATMRGAWLTADPGAKFVVAGVAFWTLGVLHLAAGSYRHASAIVGLTSWTEAHWVLLSGGLGFWLVGLMYHMLPRITGRGIFSQWLASWHFWAASAGIVIVWLSLSVAGVVQGYLQVAGAETDSGIARGSRWYIIILATRPMQAVRLLAGSLVFASVIAFIVNVQQTIANGEEVSPEPVEEPVAVGVGAA